MKLLKATQGAVREAATVIRRGGLVAFPTETVYGLGADALNPQAVAKVFETKNRPHFDPLIVHIARPESVGRLSSGADERALQLMDAFWPGPLTLVLPKEEVVPDLVTAGLPTVALRMPDHPVALDLIREADTPIAAPSANPFGCLSPTTAEHVRAQLGDKVDLILDGGACRVGLESTILDLSGEQAVLLRAGGVAVEDLERVIGPVETQTSDPTRPRAPGQLPRHYSPQTRLVLLEDATPPVQPNEKAGLLLFKARGHQEGFAAVEILSPGGDLEEAAARFFSCLHRLDQAGLDVIYAEPVPETGLGRAIMDRLRRAASRSAKAGRATGRS